MKCRIRCLSEYLVALAAAVFLAWIIIVIAITLGLLILVVLMIIWLIAEIAKITARYKECLNKCKGS